jgi:hypothetical protein
MPVHREMGTLPPPPNGARRRAWRGDGAAQERSSKRPAQQRSRSAGVHTPLTRTSSTLGERSCSHSPEASSTDAHSAHAPQVSHSAGSPRSHRLCHTQSGESASDGSLTRTPLTPSGAQAPDAPTPLVWITTSTSLESTNSTPGERTGSHDAVASSEESHSALSPVSDSHSATAISERAPSEIVSRSHTGVHTPLGALTLSAPPPAGTQALDAPTPFVRLSTSDAAGVAGGGAAGAASPPQLSPSYSVLIEAGSSLRMESAAGCRELQMEPPDVHGAPPVRAQGCSADERAAGGAEGASGAKIPTHLPLTPSGGFQAGSGLRADPKAARRELQNGPSNVHGAVPVRPRSISAGEQAVEPAVRPPSEAAHGEAPPRLVLLFRRRR